MTPTLPPHEIAAILPQMQKDEMLGDYHASA